MICLTDGQCFNTDGLVLEIYAMIGGTDRYMIKWAMFIWNELDTILTVNSNYNNQLNHS